MPDPFRGAAGLAKVIPALFNRLDRLITGVEELAVPTREMSSDVARLRRELAAVLERIHEDTQVMRSELASMGERIDSIDARLAQTERALAEISELTGRFTRLSRRHRRSNQPEPSA